MVHFVADFIELCNPHAVGSPYLQIRICDI